MFRFACVLLAAFSLCHGVYFPLGPYLPPWIYGNPWITPFSCPQSKHGSFQNEIDPIPLPTVCIFRNRDMYNTTVPVPPPEFTCERSKMVLEEGGVITVQVRYDCAPAMYCGNQELIDGGCFDSTARMRREMSGHRNLTVHAHITCYHKEAKFDEISYF